MRLGLVDDVVTNGPSCNGPQPGWSCPQYAVRNAFIAAPLGLVVGGFVGKHLGRIGGAIGGAAIVGLATWYYFSGKWWV